MHLLYFVFMVGSSTTFIGCLTPETTDGSLCKGHQSDNKLESNIKSQNHFAHDVAAVDLLSKAPLIVSRNDVDTNDAESLVHDDKVSGDSNTEHRLIKDSFEVDKNSSQLSNSTVEKYFKDAENSLQITRKLTALEFDVTVRIGSESISEFSAALVTTLTPFDVDVKGNGRLTGTQKPRRINNDSHQELLPIASPWEQRGQDNGREATDGEKVPTLRFQVIPKGESYHILDFQLTDGIFLFSYVGQLVSWMQPFDFPVEQLRDAVWNHLSIVSLFTQSLKVEVGFLICLSVGLLLSLTAPGLVLVHACYHLLRPHSNTSTSVPPPPPPPPPPNCDFQTSAGEDGDDREGCRTGVLVFFMHMIHLLLVFGIMAMFVTNEQLSSAVHKTPNVFHAALTDATTFLRNTHLQLNFIMTQSLDEALEASSADLDNVDNLLGRPIQREMATETGVDVALDALVDVSKAARALSDRVEALQGYAQETQELTLESREKLTDLRQQIDVLRRQCPRKDRSLCETVDATGLEVVLRLELILNDENLGQIRNLGGDNLTTVTSQARGEFQFIPMHVEKETRNIRNAIRRQLIRQRTVVDDSIWSLDAITRDLSAKVEDARDLSLQFVRGVTDVEQWRWLIALGCAVSVSLVWALLLVGVCCGCLGSARRASAVLVASVVLICLLTTVLWLIALCALLIGGHGEVFVCRPLYEQPGFDTLTRLVDSPGVIYKKGGFFSNLLYNNSTLDVSVREVLHKCQEDKASYSTFHLDRVFDVATLADHRKWGTLHQDLDSMNVNLTGLQLLKPELQKQLQQLLQASSVNLTNFRTQVSGQVTGKDLASFASQLESVANQITDLATASRIETLASKTRRLLESNVKILEQRKDNLVYQLAAIEIQLLPLQRQVNQSLSHFKTIQYYINNQGASIAQRKTRDYVRRLIGYLDQYRRHVTEEILYRAASCRPLWDIYNAMRQLLCRHVMDPLNGFWFTTVWCLLLLLAATPLTLKLMDRYRRNKFGGRLHNSNSAESQSETLVISEQGGSWLTPGTQEPDGW